MFAAAVRGGSFAATVRMNFSTTNSTLVLAVANLGAITWRQKRLVA